MSKNGTGASDKGEAWAVASHRRKPKQQLVQCSKSGCKGACPLNVVSRGAQAEGVPAKCFECGQKYKLPPGSQKQTDKSGNNELQQEIQRLKSELAAAKTAPDAKATATAPSTAEEATLTGEQQAATVELNKARDTLRKLENTPEDMRAFFQRPLAELVDEQKALVQSLDSRRRGLRPVDEQLKQSRSRLTSLQSRHERETKAAAGLGQQIAELQTKLADQQTKVAATAGDIEKAKLELAQLNMAAAAEVSGAHSKDTAVLAQGVHSQLTATAVRGFFQTLPTSVAGHPEGQMAITTVMQMLEKLDHAAKTQQSPASTEAAQVNEQQEHSEQQMAVDLKADDVLLDQLAEASIDPAPDGADAEITAARASQVAVAKARLAKVRIVGKAVKKTSKKP